ncbi:MAG TPA: hypothetical protein VGM98_11240 [Schlesneria sp.]|jgi:hypothetical protein
MSIRRGTVVNVFLTDEEARAAVLELRDRGFSIEQVGVAGPKSEVVAVEPEHETIVADHSAEYGAAGLATGASLGALWGLGIVAGIMPVLGPAIAGGTLAVIFTSAAAGATVAGVAGILVGMGIPHEDAEYYEAELHAGHVIVTVFAPGREAEASEIMLRNGGYTHSIRPELIETH